MTLSKHKFFLLGILLVVAIGAGLAVLNHFVREENKFHEAQQDAEAQQIIKTMRLKSNALAAPTTSAPPPQ